MAYDPRSESLRLISEGARQTGPYHLTRRRRFVPLAVDVDDDIAATLFVRRGQSGAVEVEAWTLERLSDEWHLLGGGGGGPGPDLTRRRVPAAALGGIARVELSGSTLRRSGRRILPWRARYVRYCVLHAAEEVDHIVVGQRVVPVPPHGRAIVVWRSGDVRIQAVRRDGTELDVITRRSD